MKKNLFQKWMKGLLAVFMVLSTFTAVYAETPAELSSEEGTIDEEPALISEDEITPAEADASVQAGTSTATVKATYHQAEARSMLSMINSFRTGSEAWAWNSSNTEKIYYRNLGTLKYDYDLEKAAMQRAAEIALEWGHYRPDGSYCVTAYPAAFNNTWRGECIAMGYGSAASAFARWKEDDYNYAGQAHRRNMLSPNFNAVGIGFCECDGTYWFVQEFSSANINGTPVNYDEKPRNVNIPMLTERGSFTGSFARTALEKDPRLTVEINYPVSVPGVNVEFAYRGYRIYDIAVTTTVKSSNTNIVRVENNKLVGVSPGTAVVTIEKKCGSYTVTKKLNITVRNHVHDYKLTWTWADDYSSAIADYVCTVDAEHAGSSEAVITEERIEPLCYEDGIITYTGTVTLDGIDYTNEQYVRLPKTGEHDYAEPVYEWSEDLTSVTASALCLYGQEVLTETVNTVYEVTEEPTDEEPGTGRLTAYFENEIFEPQYVEFEIPVNDENTPVSFDIKEDTLNILYGNTAKLETSVAPEGTAPVIIWASSDPEVAFVDQEGNVTGVKAGTATITGYTLYGHSDTCEVRVLFTDVTNSGKYFYDPVYWAASEGVTTGTTPSTFSPESNCKREQIVTFLWRMMGSPEPEKYVSFTDVKPDRYYFKAISWAYENGITTGVSATEFGVGQACTREMAVTFLYRAAGSPPVYNYYYFWDVPTDKYYYMPVRWAAVNGITTGVSTYYFGVGETCTRAMIVTFLYRYIE